MQHGLLFSLVKYGHLGDIIQIVIYTMFDGSLVLGNRVSIRILFCIIIPRHCTGQRSVNGRNSSSVVTGYIPLLLEALHVKLGHMVNFTSGTISFSIKPGILFARYLFGNLLAELPLFKSLTALDLELRLDERMIEDGSRLVQLRERSKHLRLGHLILVAFSVFVSNDIFLALESSLYKVDVGDVSPQLWDVMLKRISRVRHLNDFLKNSYFFLKLGALVHIDSDLFCILEWHLLVITVHNEVSVRIRSIRKAQSLRIKISLILR